MACRTTFDGYFEAVFEHGGDPNLVRTDRIFSGHTPLFAVIARGRGNKKEKIKFLIEKGANLDHMSGSWATPTMDALSGGRYDIALMLLDAGADHKVYQPKSNARLIHVVIGEEHRSKIWTPEQKADYEKVVQWLIDHGESVEEARADIARWKSWIDASGEYRRNMDAEIAERMRREAQEKKPVGQVGTPP
ncbi:Ankyrin repeats (3 copies) [Anatilimnocola aggregata]|uniref:Ankyrin repeats (3 copies) n=2 Tax=Anatilimnocola aggregata TaxID=2528021 RepID=A0A517YCF7_9BACT|nr:Ankyrin repeats (3 copies) [Anatilimnocola aggregata]